MMPYSRFALPLLWCILAGAANDSPMQAGLWRETLTFKINAIDGKPPAPSESGSQSDTSEDCYTAEETEDAALFFGGAAADQGCDKLVITAASGRIRISGSCTFNGVPFVATGQGRYDEKSYSESIKLDARIEGHVVAASAELVGRYIRPCSSSDTSSQE